MSYNGGQDQHADSHRQQNFPSYFHQLIEAVARERAAIPDVQYMETATLAMNQKMSCTRSRTGGNEQDQADQRQHRAESAQPDGLNFEERMLRHAGGAVET